MWDKIKKFFLSSETIFMARVQVFLGAVLSVVVTMDPHLLAGVIGSKWFPLFLMGHGILMEYLRRRRDLKLAEKAVVETKKEAE